MVYSWECGSALISRLIVLGREINLVIHHCHSLFSDLHAHSPVCICQSGWVMSPPSKHYHVKLHCSTPERAGHKRSPRGSRSDRVAVTYILNILLVCAKPAFCDARQEQQSTKEGFWIVYEGFKIFVGVTNFLRVVNRGCAWKQRVWIGRNLTREWKLSEGSEVRQIYSLGLPKMKSLISTYLGGWETNSFVPGKERKDVR